MDAIAALLDGPRARGAFMLRTLLDPPWGMRIQTEDPLEVAAIVRGSSWVMRAGEPPLRLEAGDLAIFRGPDHYTMADAPATEPGVIVHPGQRCQTTDGVDLAESMSLGVRTWGNSAEGETVMIIGAYQVDGEVSRRLLKALPPLIVLRAGAWNSPLVGLLAHEVVKDDPGQEAVLDRLLDLLLISALREWFARPEAEPPAWYRASADPVVGHALGILHNNPGEAWTVASLASEVGVSRAALARRFTELVGEPPMKFLTGWRLALAADLLREPGNTIGSVAAQVGYGSPFALSTAFKRERGMSPREHRIAVPA